jgi:hypothetical protein
MPALNMRDERLLLRALDAAAEELDLPLTSRQVAGLARVAARKLAESAPRVPPTVPEFRGPS